MDNPKSGETINFFSVIIPVYNVEPYLKQCIDSVLTQSFMDFEVILIDDCSTDRSGLICDEVAGGDNRIKVVHKQVNEGLGCARNTGLDKARGQYVLFLDSDDYWTDTDMLLNIYGKVIASQCDLLILGYEKYFDSDHSFQTGLLPVENYQLADNKSELIRTNTYKALAWNKVVKRELITKHRLFFPSMRYSEDTLWCYWLLKFSRKIELLARYVIAYRQREGSIVSQKDESKQREHISYTIKSLEICIHDLENTVGQEDEKQILYSYLSYEYTWLLGKAYPFWRQFAPCLQKLRFLMNYRLSNKVKKVALLDSVFPLRMTAFVCYQFITHRRSANKRKDIYSDR